MGNYTEIILGFSFKKDTPKEIINVIKYMLNVKPDNKPKELPNHLFFSTPRWDSLFMSDSAYFPCYHASFYKSEFNNSLVLDVRSNLKDYDDEIGLFCDWIKPYVESGSGNNDIYCMSIYEDSNEVIIYSKE